MSIDVYRMPYKDPDRQKVSQHESYLRNKDRVKARDRARLDRNQEFIKKYKSRDDVTCVRCDEGRWQCLDFHHPDPSSKDMSIADLVKRRYRIERILEEINKCEVLCANCHRVEHHGNIWLQSSMARV